MPNLNLFLPLGQNTLHLVPFLKTIPCTQSRFFDQYSLNWNIKINGYKWDPGLWGLLSHLHSLMPFAGSLGSGTLDEAQPAQVTVIMVWSKPGAARNPEGNMEREIQEFLSDCFIFDQNSVLFPQMENSSEFQNSLGLLFRTCIRNR